MIDIVAAVDSYKERKIEIWPCRSNRASNMGDPCLRRLVYERTAWQQKRLHDLAMQYIFDLGKEQEQAVLDELRHAGLEVLEQQRAFDWPEYEITGKIDCKIVSNGEALPVEIKCISPFAFSALNSIEDMHKARAVWIKKMPAQLTLYMLMANKEEAVFLLRNKVTGRLKQIAATLDYAYGEQLLQKAEQINRHLAEGTLPERTVKESLCEDCGFSHICLPPIEKEAAFLIDGELEAMLERREALKAAVSEYEEVDKEIKRRLNGREETIIGNWHCRGRWIERKGYFVEPARIWQMTIRRMK